MCVTHCRRTRTPITTLSTPSPVAHTELEHLLHRQTEGGHVHKQIRMRAEHASRATTGHPVLLRTAQLQHVPETMATLRCSLPRLSAGRGSRRWCASRPDTVDHLHIESKGSGRNVSDVNPQRWQQRERRNVAAVSAQLDQVPPPWLAPQLPYLPSSTRARAVEGPALGQAPPAATSQVGRVARGGQLLHHLVGRRLPTAACTTQLLQRHLRGTQLWPPAGLPGTRRDRPCAVPWRPVV